MTEPHDPNRTVDHSSAPADSLTAGLAAGFGPPRSSLEDMPPVLLREADGDSAPVVQPQSDAMLSPEQTGHRYQLLGEIARGGMGAVLRGRDVDLGRDLAVKVLLEKYVDRPEVARRFIEEAQIGGQLQHPGVVPVYDIGRFGERPFFTMKLVKGQTLAALLGERTEPSTDRPRFLGIALQVAQALAYAHAKGVIHRDLKPANIMVGAFGEVQVMDWGLAKVLAEGGTADEEKASRERERPEDASLIRTARSTGSVGTFGTQTEAGSLLGTPAYMPPEQANGDVTLLDRRADVFGLGAIMCEILTGKPPYVGRSADEVRRKAANGDLADATARLDACGADPELIVLTRACLAPEAIDRLRDAQAVADALTAYLDGVQERLRQAELAEAEARARAVEEAKRRRLTLALAATVLLAVTLGGGGWLYVKTERDARQAQLAREVNDALNKAAALREQARTANVGGAALFAQAREQAQRALALVENGQADDTLKAQVRRLQAELDKEDKDRVFVDALDEAQLAQAENAPGQNRFASERAVPKFRDAFRAYGLPAGEGEPEAAGQRLRQRPAAIQEAADAALAEWQELAGHPRSGIQEPHRSWLQAVLEAVEPADAWSRQVRLACQEGDPARREADLAALAKSADVAKLPARALTRLAHRLPPRQAVDLLRRAQRQHPADFWVNHDLGVTLVKVIPPEPGEAVRFLTVAVALRPQSPGAHYNLGHTLARQGRPEEAIASLRRAINLDPSNAAVHCALGIALADRGELDAAIASFRKSLELEPKDTRTLSNLGNALQSKGQLDEAIACHRKAIAIACRGKGIVIDTKLVGGFYYNLGNALKDRGQLDEAIACYKKARDFDPEDASIHYNLGLALAVKGQADEAIPCLRKAIAFDGKLARAHCNLGALLTETKRDYDGAIACFREAIRLDPKYALAFANLGNALLHKGQVEEAIASYRKAIDLNPQSAANHLNLGLALARNGRSREGLACMHKAIELEPKNALGHTWLGQTLAMLGRPEESLPSFRKAIELEPKNAGFHTNLGVALAQTGRVGEAIACWRRAIALDPKLAAAHSNIGKALLASGQAHEAIPFLRRAIALDPKVAAAHTNLGNALAGKGQEDEAIACFRKVIALDPKDDEARTHLARAQRLAAARDKLPAFQNGSYTPATNAERLALAEWCQIKKLHHTATRLYVAAFAADPKLADDLSAAHRYHAACHAALVGAGHGADAGKLDNQQRARLRQRALAWLHADLPLLDKQMKSGRPGEVALARAVLEHWRKDPDLAGLRDKDPLARLPAEERAACAKLWADVAALLKKAEERPKGGKP
jgi:serine/threonine-protein kinase